MGSMAAESKGMAGEAAGPTVVGGCGRHGEAAVAPPTAVVEEAGWGGLVVGAMRPQRLEVAAALAWLVDTAAMVPPNREGDVWQNRPELPRLKCADLHWGGR
jgi:hypothetical protein